MAKENSSYFAVAKIDVTTRQQWGGKKVIADGGRRIAQQHEAWRVLCVPRDGEQLLILLAA